MTWVTEIGKKLRPNSKLRKLYWMDVYRGDLLFVTKIQITNYFYRSIIDRFHLKKESCPVADYICKTANSNWVIYFYSA